MKKVITLLICACVLFACQKSEHQQPDYLERVKTALQDSISKGEFLNLDFQRAVLTKVDSVNLYLLRIPLREAVGNDFVLLQTTQAGDVIKGRFVSLIGEVNDKNGHKSFQGSISLHSLHRELVLASPIKDGFITAFHQASQHRSLLQPGHVLPEVVITYTIPSSGSGLSWSSWIWLQSLFGGSNAQPVYSFLTSEADSPGGGGSGGGGIGGPTGSTGGLVQLEVPILIDIEDQDEKTEIDLQKFINCFNAIPNAGADCPIEIFTDIPVDSNPNAFFDLDARSPGHVFINVTKRNGTQSASQNIGFYPKSGYKASTYAPTPSKLVDNSHHEFNASYKMTLTPERLTSVLQAMQQHSAHNYDVDQYNCTDFALDVFNSVRGVPLVIPRYGLPGSPLTQATRTPGGLYNKLKEMVNNNDPEKANITMGIVKGWAGGSTGPCN